MMLLKCLLIVNMEKDKCWFCCVMVFVSLILLLRVFICICKVLMLFDIVVLNSDFEIFLIKLKSFFFDFKD